MDKKNSKKQNNIVENEVKLPLLDEKPVADSSQLSKVPRKKRVPKKESKPLISSEFLTKEDKEDIEVKIRDNNGKKVSAIIQRQTPLPNEGLTKEQVDIRKKANLYNRFKNIKTKSTFSIIWSNFFTIFNLMCIGISIWMLTAGVHEISRYVFMVIILANMGMGVFQEYRAKLTIDKMSLVNQGVVSITRESQVIQLPTTDIVLDDIVFMQTGNQICADGIIVEGSLEVNESLLTGEQDLIVKKPGDFVYSGSFIVSGSAKFCAKRIGGAAYIQTIAKQAKATRKTNSSLLKSLKMIILIIGVVIIPICALLFLSMRNAGELEYKGIVEATAGAAVGMIPAGLLLLTSTSLSVGVIRLAKVNTIVQNPYCIETLARVDTLCLDKTGTITDGTMTVKDVIEYENKSPYTYKVIIPAMINVLADDNLTTKALVERFGTAKKLKAKNKIAFSSARKFSAVEFENNNTYIMGAPEFVLGEKIAIVKQTIDLYAKKGFRVLVLAHATGSIDTKEENINGEVNPICIITIEDTIRPDAYDTITIFKNANVDLKVISGDNPITVSNIAARAGVENADKYISLNGLDDSEVIKLAEEYTVFGRVSPEQKRLLLRTLKSKGRIVAMTGDGVNDILALKEANCSIAMASGSEATRNIADIVLVDSNFSTLPIVVSEGRRVINNVQKASALFLTKTIFSLILSIIAINISYYPIKTNQLILIDLFCIGIPAFILTLENNNNQVRGHFLSSVIKKALPGALTVCINAIIIYLFAAVPELGLRDASGKINDLAFSSFIVIVSTFTCLMVLLKMCRPFNKLRGILFFIMATMSILIIIIVPQLLDIMPLFSIDSYYIEGAAVPPFSFAQLLFLIVLLESTFPIMYIIANIIPWSRRVISYVLIKISEVGSK